MVAGLLGAVPVANAATVEVLDEQRYSRGGYYTVSVLRVTAGLDESNQLSVTQTERPRVLVRDAVPLVPGPGCTATSATAVFCDVPALDSASVRAGDRDDSVVIEGVPLSAVDGGAGDDVLEARGTANAIGLHGGPGDDRLIGGDGTDLLYGGPGRDQVTGGPGDDGLSGGSDVDDPSEADPSSCSEPDVIEGGPGRDSVGYGDHPCDVTVDLNRLPGLAGAADERDQVSGIEGASGGPGDDRLIGDGQWNQLSGRGGHDVVSGGDGDDLISGAEGDDVLSGGAGHDLINDGLGGNVMEGGAGNDSLHGAGDLRGGEGDDRLSGTEDHNVFDGGPGDDDIYSAEFATEDQRRAAPPEFVRCGDGHDTVAPVDSSVPPGPPSRDVLIACEQADLNLGPLIPLLPGGPIGRQVAMRLPCPKQFRGGCAYSVQIYRSGRRIGSGRGRVRRAREGRVGVRMRSRLPTGTPRRIRVVLKRRSRDVLERAAYTVLR